ncbi:MAG: AmmeMemoRadiSam system radical SAM enzyme [Ignavibacteria bacterium]|nr:AmmeMemoRadiSam system radical SAM enzyme [Ignavibacteria bacterium]
MKRKTEYGKLSKRDFLKYCLLGGCSLAFGFKRNEFLHTINSFPQVPKADELWKWSKEALFYEKVDGGLKCFKCPNECLLDEGETSWCRNRINYKNKMYSIAYGNPCAVHIDPIEKKPLYHFLPTARAFSIAVAGCNLRCLNCQNWQISQFSPKETDNYDLMPEKVIEQCLKSKSETIAYTYSEPITFYEYAYDTAKLAHEKGIKNVWKSNGYINEKPLRQLCKVLDAANIDLKCFDNDVYLKLNSAKLDPVLKSLKIFKEENVWLEITNLVIPTWTDNLDTIKKMCEWLVKNNLHDSPLHFTRFTPMYKLTQLPLTPVSTLEKARDIALKSGMKYVYVGNVPGHQAENTYCHNCKKMIIERRGFVILNNYIERKKCKFCGEKIPGVWN